jgi:hypothetical protein
MTELWESLTLELGSAFKNQYGDTSSSTFKHWCKELVEFTREDLQRGFIKFKNSGKTYMSLNIFRSHCKASASDLGLPDLEASFTAMIFGRWGQLPEAFQVVFADHRYRLRQLSEEAARKQFKPIYENTVERIAKGEVIKKPERTLISSDSGTVHAKKHNGPVGNAAMKGLLSMMGSSKARA